jgi:GH24 family phage-related lysozyme (muramidase)
MSMNYNPVVVDNNHLSVSEEVVSFIKEEEGLVLNAYWDVDSYAIGYGSKRGVYGGMTISIEEADRRLREDISRAEQEVKQELSDISLTTNQFSALVSLVYNTGISSILPGTTIRSALEEGDYSRAANGFLLWVTDGTYTLPNLVARREAERSIFIRQEPTPITLTALRDTYIKDRATSSILQLSTEEYSPLLKGEVIEGLLIRITNSHYQIDIGGSMIYIFTKHFTLP